MLVEIIDQLLPSDHTDEVVRIIDDRNEVLPGSALHDIFHAGVDLHRLIVILHRDIGHPDLFRVLQLHVEIVFDFPEQVTLGHGAIVFAVLRQDRDGRVAVELHFFERLPQCIIFLEICNITFRSQEEKNIHEKSSIYF